MFMGEEHPVEPIDLGLEELLAQVRRGIDQHAGDAGSLPPFHQERRPPPTVLGIAGITRPPAERRTRDATRGAAAEDREPHGHAPLAVKLAQIA
jgi:hypothetical protein